MLFFSLSHKLKSVDPNNLSPKEALEFLFKLQEILVSKI
jgi:hypothetical protein